jgi:hypothetical protein
MGSAGWLIERIRDFARVLYGSAPRRSAMCGLTKTEATSGHRSSHLGGALQTLRWLCCRISLTRCILNTLKPFTACFWTFFGSPATGPSRRNRLPKYPGCLRGGYSAAATSSFVYSCIGELSTASMLPCSTTVPSFITNTSCAIARITSTS